MAVGELIKKALLKPNSTWWYIAPTYRQAKNIAWRMLLEYYYNLPDELRGEKNESELWVSIGNGSRIELKGADNEDSLRGLGLHGMVVDEVASIRSWDTLWQEVLRPALTDFHGAALFISSPKGFNHFYKLYNQEQFDSDYKSFRFTSYDNPLLDPKEIEKAQLELTEDAFAQEYLADFRKQMGLIYKEFDRNLHVKEEIEPNFGWKFYRAMDFGGQNATVCLWLAVDNSDTVYLFKEYYNNKQRVEFHANVIRGMTDPNYPILETYGDPSGAQAILDYSGYDINITPALKVFSGDEGGWVLHGINKVRQALKVDPLTGRPRLYIHKSCVNTIREFENYHWREFMDGKPVKDEPEKVDDHCMDALRYFFVSYESPRFTYEAQVWTPPANTFTGYSSNIQEQ